MLRFLVHAGVLLLVTLLAVAQQAPRRPPKDDVQRCRPKLVSRDHSSSRKKINVKAGEKPTGYPPVIAFQILESGIVVNARVKRSSGIADRDAYALESIKKWRFDSRTGCGTVESEAVAVHYW